LAEARARLAFAQRQLQTAEEHVAFSDEDLNKVRARLTQERQGLDGELQHTMAEERAQSETLVADERELDDGGDLCARVGDARR